jgi:hypothetical protein
MHAGMRRARIDEFEFSPLPAGEVARVLWESFAVLDVEHPRQRGLTMRTFETIGAGKKLITTNTGIRDHDFFDERNILVVDRHAPRIPAGFFEVAGVALAPAVRHRYSIAGWLDDLLADEPRPADAVAASRFVSEHPASSMDRSRSGFVTGMSNE